MPFGPQMEENQIQELQTTSCFYKNHQLFKKALQFLVSLSLFSFLFLSCSSSPNSHFFHYLKFHSSTLVLPILSQALDRKFIFLICNGIVAVLAKTLSFTNSSSPSSDFVEDVVKAVAETGAPVEDRAIIESLEHASAGIEQEEEDDEDLRGESPALISGTEEEDQEVEESDCLIPPLTAEDEGNEVNVSTEELNRKIEEFIRKMKEEIRIGAQQPLIAV
ncbi:hypothetical protein Vadar_017989 [Vaccinium darrowii]|uniref:Uncharacterized protein n=1 Tax=Vaccinium darrowii TaxID=229202 RepID=A0ACB7XAK9_9ERIC|nr:hypothetical protein Vadar_017989 [Vaccinium darrowii]